MYEQHALITGNWDNVIAAIREMLAAGLCRIGMAEHGIGNRSVQITLGDDSEVRAYYARMMAEREDMERRAVEAGKAGNSGLACALLQASRDELLCRYQERSASVGEAPYTLSSNIYGWCVGSHLLANLYGGKFAVTDRGATLEQCIAYGCRLSRSKGATLTFYVCDLVWDGAVSAEQAADLVRLIGGTDEQVEWVLGTPARKAARVAEDAIRAEKNAAAAKVREATMVDVRRVYEAVRAPFAADKACKLTSGVGYEAATITLRGKSYNPSLTCEISGRGYVVRRTDFDGVRKHVSTVVAAVEPPTAERVSIALRAAWMALTAEQAS